VEAKDNWRGTTEKACNFNVKAVLLYASECWTITWRTWSRSQVFINKCLQNHKI